MAAEEVPTFTILEPEVYLPLLTNWYPRLGKGTGLSVVKGGWANSNYCYQTANGTRYLLKVCDEKSYDELLVQAAVLERLRMAQFPCPYVHPFGDAVRDLHGTSEAARCVLQVDSPMSLRIMLYDYLPGAPGVAATVTPWMMRGLGRALGKLHAVDLSLLPCTPPAYPIGAPVIREFLASRASETTVHEFEGWLATQMGLLGPLVEDPRLPQGLLHGDLFPDNAMFDAATAQLVGVLDFEEASLGPLALDVGMTIVGCAYPSDNALDVALAREMLAAYQAVRPLSALERASLSAFVSFAAISIAFWRYRQFNIRHPEVGRPDHYRIMYERAMAVPADLFKLLTE